MAVVSSYLGANVPVRCSRVVPVHGPLQGACDGVRSRGRPGPGWRSADGMFSGMRLLTQSSSSRWGHVLPGWGTGSGSGGRHSSGTCEEERTSEPSGPPPSARRNAAPWWPLLHLRRVQNSLLRAVGFR